MLSVSDTMSRDLENQDNDDMALEEFGRVKSISLISWRIGGTLMSVMESGRLPLPPLLLRPILL
jgi:hypothetical protein